MKKCKVMPSCQPSDWKQAFERQASIEGVNLSIWVGEACRQLLEKQNPEAAKNLGQRPQKGKYERKVKS